MTGTFHMKPNPNPAEWERAYLIRLPEPTMLMNEWQRMHWAQQSKYKKRLTWMILSEIGSGPRVPIRQAWIHIKRGNPKPFPDHDGFIGGIKPLLDALICPRLRRSSGLGLIVDDAPQFLRHLTWESVATKKGEGFTEIFIHKYAPEKKAA